MYLFEIPSNTPWVRGWRGSSLQVKAKDKVQIRTSVYIFYSFYGRARAKRLRWTMKSKGGKVMVNGQINAKVIMWINQPLVSKVNQNWGQARIQGHFFLYLLLGISQYYFTTKSTSIPINMSMIFHAWGSFRTRKTIPTQSAKTISRPKRLNLIDPLMGLLRTPAKSSWDNYEA